MELILVRGLPGSGKSTKAEEIKRAQIDISWVETDMWFMSPEGEYHYDPRYLKVAHEWCKRETDICLRSGLSVIVSNTFSQYWEMLPYLKLAHKYGARVRVITCKGEFANIHGVPDDVIQKMRDRWED